MPEETPDHRVPRPAIVHAASLAIVATAFFAGGFWTSRLLDEDRVRDQAEARFRELLTVGIDLGFVTVDTQKIAEIECISSEAEWEDHDAMDRGEGCGR
jgi:hypothetical protein